MTDRLTDRQTDCSTIAVSRRIQIASYLCRTTSLSEKELLITLLAEHLYSVNHPERFHPLRLLSSLQLTIEMKIEAKSDGSYRDDFVVQCYL
jgi:hypothetical protein